MKKVRVGLAGMNVIGLPMGGGAAKNPRGEIVALCDVVEERMHKHAAELPGSVKLYTDYTAMCSDPEVDAVFVATPNQWHVPIGLSAVRNDKHVMIIKPLADSLPAANELVLAAESAGVVNMMALSTRFADDAQYLGRLNAEGQFGDIYYARARSVRRSGIPINRPGFVQKGGGAFRDMGVHMLDAAWWIMGMPQPVSVSGVAGAKFGPRGVGHMTWAPQSAEVAAQFAADDYGGGFIRFEGGAGLQVESFWASHQADDRQIELFGTEAGASLYPLRLYQTVHGAPMDTTIELPKSAADVWDTMAAHFIACVLDGVPCEAPLRHGLVVQEMLEALLLSAESGREVSLAH